MSAGTVDIGLISTQGCSVLATGVAGGPWELEMSNGAKYVPGLLTLTSEDLTGGTDPDVEIELIEHLAPRIVWLVTITGEPTGGTFTLGWNVDNALALITTNIDFDALPGDLETAFADGGFSALNLAHLPPGVGQAGESVAFKANANNTEEVKMITLDTDSGSGWPMSPGDGIAMDISDAAELLFNSASNGMGIHYIITRP